MRELYTMYPELAAAESHLEDYVTQFEDPTTLHVPPALKFAYPGITVHYYEQLLTKPSFLLSTIELCSGCFDAVVSSTAVKKGKAPRSSNSNSHMPTQRRAKSASKTRNRQ